MYDIIKLVWQKLKWKNYQTFEAADRETFAGFSRTNGFAVDNWCSFFIGRFSWFYYVTMPMPASTFTIAIGCWAEVKREACGTEAKKNDELFPLRSKEDVRLVITAEKYVLYGVFNFFCYIRKWVIKVKNNSRTCLCKGKPHKRNLLSGQGWARVYCIFRNQNCLLGDELVWFLH